MKVFLRRNQCRKWKLDLFSLALFVLFTLVVSAAQAQTIVKGTVKDETGSPLPGVNVLVKGTTTGTTTDADGIYSISLSSAGDDVILAFSFIGYETEEFSVSNRTTIDVMLIPNLEALSEVVVIGYGTQRKPDVTGAISSINSADITQSAAITVDQALQGRIAGVQMTTNTGLPGGGSSIQIRGFNSINSTNEPIYVIDGVIINSGTNSYTYNAISALSTADIETIDVLKDASAAAIYGAQGANGVIIITTKRGKEGKPRVMLESQVSYQQIPKYLR
jgi:TonB-dependent SusC/RagA subfamily outer membrane receptor